MKVGFSIGAYGGLTRGNFMIEVSMKQLLEAGVHFGHQKRFWNPQMGTYIYGVHKKIHIINLDKTLPLFRDALAFVHKLAARRGKVLFVGTKFAAREVIKEEALRCGMPYVNQRWLGGMLTNYKTIRQSIRRLKEMEEMTGREDAFKKMTKKEILNFMREKDKLAASLDGVKNMGGLPDALFVIDVEHERIAINEANRLGIPVIGVVDTNSSPSGVEFLIPGNDDALRSIQLYCQSIAGTILDARGSLALSELEDKMQSGDVEEEVVVRKVFKKKSSGASERTAGNGEEVKAARPAAKKDRKDTAAAKPKRPAAKVASPQKESEAPVLSGDAADTKSNNE
jgi:small subunit ribosomal protein S2